MVNCPHCNAEIDNDSVFCDQCSAELRRCPKCGSLRKGKFCPSCGCPTELVSKMGASPSASGSAATGTPAGTASAPFTATSPAPGAGSSYVGSGIPPSSHASYVGAPGQRPAAQPMPTRMMCRTLGIYLPLKPGAVLGRVSGDYVQQLGVCKYMSGTHARVDLNGDTWTLTDLGSRNGTAVNGMPCRPSVPVALKIGDVVKFALSYDFYVE